MGIWIEGIMLLLLLSNLVLLGTSRLTFAIRVVALQGIVLGVLPLATHVSAWSPRLVALALAALVLKGNVFPWLLRRALRDADVRHEVEPYVNTTFSMLLGALALALLLAWSGRIDLPAYFSSPLALPTAFFTAATGLFLIATRKKALTQVLGYLVMENGIYTFGAMLALEQPWLVEMGVLLDVFVAVFVMGIIIFHISQEFDHVDTSRLTRLHDLQAGHAPDRLGVAEPGSPEARP